MLQNLKRGLCLAQPLLIMDFSLLSMLEFFADPKNGDMRNKQPPAMRVRDRS